MTASRSGTPARPAPAPAASRPRELWGYAILWVASLLALVRLERQAVPGHYRVFTGAAKALWSHGPAYATDFGTHVGYFFYSPACGMFAFGPLSLLPEKLGLAVYALVSLNLFVAGSLRFARALLNRPAPELAAGASVQGFPQMQWFFALIAPQVAGAVAASKLELAIAGLLFLGLAWLIEAAGSLKTELRAAGVLSMILNWKFQPLPVIGLALLAWLVTAWPTPRRARAWVLPALIAGFTAFWYALPFALLPTDYLVAQHRLWSSSLASFVHEAWLNFENVFAFAAALGLRPGFGAAQIATLAVGAAFALVELLWLLGPGRGLAEAARLRGGLLLAAGLGASFMTALSPLGQNNALVLYAPLLLAALAAQSFAAGRWRRAWNGILGAAWAVMMFAYSDAVPEGARETIRHYSVKAPVCLALGIALAIYCFDPSYGRSLPRE